VRGGLVQRITGTMAVLALIGSLWVGYAGWGVPVPKDGPWPCIKIWQAGIVVGWIILPPLYFWCEYFLIYKPPEKGNPPKPDFESFKYTQDISSKIWLAVSSALLALYFLKDLKLGS